jgi:NMT1/THI5 like
MTKRSNDRFRCRDDFLPNADKNPKHRFARLGSVVGGRTDPGATRVVTYSSRSIASIDLFVAQERGFFREEGLDPQLVQVRTNAAIAAIASGEAHALGCIGSAIRAIPRGAFTTNGILTDGEIEEHLKADAQILGLPAPVPPARVFDFLAQREVNQELGVK